MQQVYANVSKVMVDSRNGSNLLYLPLDRLLQQGGVTSAGGAGAPTSEAAQPVSPASTTDARSRDGGRSRERESR